MDYFAQFHWWYVLVGLFVFFIVFGKGKGGIVVKRFTADMQILDNRFEGCDPEADYSIFKAGKPDHIDIEIERLTIPVDDELEFVLNGKRLAVVKVKRNNEAEFDHWSDEDIYFPKVNEGDELLVKYQDAVVIKGIFRID